VPLFSTLCYQIKQSKNSTMKAIAYQQFGNIEVLQTIAAATPAVQPNEVLVKVKAVSINPLDWKIRKGEMKLMSGAKFPKRPGIDFSGVVEAVGAAVTAFKKGDAVFGVVKNSMKDGALSEYIAVPATNIWEKPAHLSFPQAAAVPITGAAALTALDKMGTINSSTKILVNGATSGFGMFLLQLLKHTGASTTAVTSTHALNTAKQWGAHAVIDYTKENVLAKGVRYDVVIDLSGKMSYKNAKQIMQPKALFLNPTPQPIDIPTSLIKNLFTGKKHIALLTAPSQKNIPLLLNAIEKGLQVEVNKVFPFAQTREAYHYAEQGGYTGKVVIEVN
jgi:NADPH:quinone reductase-like Zn-dependent oxidoreductase